MQCNKEHNQVIHPKALGRVLWDELLVLPRCPRADKWNFCPLHMVRLRLFCCPAWGCLLNTQNDLKFVKFSSF